MLKQTDLVPLRGKKLFRAHQQNRIMVPFQFWGFFNFKIFNSNSPGQLLVKAFYNKN